MQEIKYNLNGHWLAPVVPYLLKKEEYEAMLEQVIFCQKQLSDDISKLDLTTSKGDFMLSNAALVSHQIMRYRQTVEGYIKYYIEPTPGSVMGINPDEISAPKNRGDKSTSTRNFRGAR